MTYPVLFLRIKAMFMDSLSLSILVIFLAFLPGKLGIDAPALRWLILIGPLLLFEPMMIWRTGGSVGHHYAGIRVISERTGENLFILNGVARLIVKLTLGLPSVITMVMTKRHRSLHDLLSGSVVVFKDEARAPQRHKLAPRDITFVGRKPSVLRRLAVAVAYWLLMLFVIAIPISLLISDACIDAGACTEREITILDGTGTLTFAAAVLLLALGMVGKLPGAYWRKSSTSPEA
ncbi:MAG: RDD family protein [Pseudomonadota bacterium]